MKDIRGERVADDDYVLKEEDWPDLVLSVMQHQCTPFVGSGACAGVLPTGGELAKKWADQEGYPFPNDDENLIKVAQFVAVKIGSLNTKRRLVARFAELGRPDFARPGEPHMTLARLGLPVYITTNYDDFMFRALQLAQPSPPHAKDYKPQRDHCRWYEPPKKEKATLQETPSPRTPVVYHLHGVLDTPKSMVLIEDDYLDFLVATSEQLEVLIPSEVREALSNTSLLFIGYKLEDLDFKVILRRLSTWMRRAEGANHVAVQIRPKAAGEPPTDEENARIERQCRYIARHYGLQSVKVFWGTAEEFCKKLSTAMEAAKGPA
jgi:hypothetical protein